jgi:two-component system OmpR family sensor kinase
MRQRVLLILVPAILTLAVVLFLDSLGIIAFGIVLHADLDVILLVSGIGGSIFVATWLALRERMTLLRDQSLRQARQEAAAERIRFLRRLDHELKNPLTAIRAALANLADLDDPVLRAEVLDGINLQVLRLSQLVTSLRKLADMGSHPLEQSPIDLEALLEEAMLMAHEEPGADERDLTLTISRPLPPILGEEDLLLLCLYNLLNNAVKFTRPGDRIELSAYPVTVQEQTCARIAVADSGPGIPAEDLPHVWEELYRGQVTYGAAGSGIGLAMVKSVVERHGGSVTVVSTLERGTTFTLTLPAGDITE